MRVPEEPTRDPLASRRTPPGRRRRAPRSARLSRNPRFTWYWSRLDRRARAGVRRARTDEPLDARRAFAPRRSEAPRRVLTLTPGSSDVRRSEYGRFSDGHDLARPRG